MVFLKDGAKLPRHADVICYEWVETDKRDGEVVVEAVEVFLPKRSMKRINALKL